MTESTEFHADLYRHFNGHVLTVKGELDIHTGRQLREATKTATRQWVLPHSRLLIDLTNMTFIDGAGLGVLVDSRDAAIRSARTFQLSGASAQMCRLMALTGLWDLLDSQITPDHISW